MLEELDSGVGQLLDAIDELEISDNTYVFFTADNGGRGTVPGGTEYPNGHSHVAALRYRDRLCAASQIASILLESI